MAGLLVWALSVQSGAAQGPDTPPDWLRKPRPEDLLAVWPTEAHKRGLGGEAIIRCLVSAQGALYDCKVLKESPPGEGFGAAALALTPQLLMKPAMKDGRPVVGNVTIPVRFPDIPAPTGTRIPGDSAYAMPNRVRVLSNVPWREAPTYAQVAAAYPEKARAQGVGGRATLNCQFTDESRLQRCEVVNQEPRGYGFGRAARSLAPLFVGPPPGPDGPTLEGIRTTVLVTFAKEMLQEVAPTIGKPNWAALPTATDLQAGYPKAALEAGVTTARIVLGCTVQAGGDLGGCRVVSEEPEGLGFGPAALALSRSFRLSVWSEEGLPTIGGAVKIPIRYELPKAATAETAGP